MRRLALLLLAPLALTAGAACSSDDSGKADPLGERVTTTSHGKAPDVSIDAKASQIELLDAGAEPRVQVVLDPPADCNQKVTLTQEQSITQDISGTDGADEAPSSGSSSGSEMDAEYRCTSVTADRIRYEMEYTGGRVLHGDSDTNRSMRNVIRAMVGHAQAITVDRHGQIVEFQTPSYGSTGDETFDQMIDAVSSGLEGVAKGGGTPLPSEAIGVGARWRQTGETSAGGVAMRVTSEYLVTEVDADHLVTTQVTTLEAVPGPVNPPGMPVESDLEMAIVSGRLTGAGTTTWDLHGIAALFDQTIAGKMTMSVRQGSNHAEIVQAQRQHQKLAPRP